MVTIRDMLHNKSSIIQIKDDKTELCCARAIVTGIAIIENHPKVKQIKIGRKEQEYLARDLHAKAGVKEGPCGIEEIRKFQDALPDYRIVVLSFDHFNAAIFKGPVRWHTIYLYFHDNHYDLITSMKAFLNRSYFCDKCQVGYNAKEKHTGCVDDCKLCMSPGCPEGEIDTWVHCSECNRNFKNQRCFENHKSKMIQDKTVCQTYYRCKRCDVFVNVDMNGKRGKHDCTQRYCSICKEMGWIDHQCFIKPVENSNNHDSPQNADAGRRTDRDCGERKGKAKYKKRRG